MSAAMNKANQQEKAVVVRVLSPTLNWRIERTEQGFALYDVYGYSGTYQSQAEALRAYNAPATNYDHNSTPDGV